MKYIFQFYALPLYCLLQGIHLFAQPQILWDKNIGWEGWEDLNALQVLPDGIIVGGSSSSVITFNRPAMNNDYSQNYMVAKLDFDGNILWKKMYGGPQLERLWKVIPTQDGGFLIGGTSYSDVGLEKTENSRGDGDAWIVKTDGQGNKLWDKTFGGDTLDEAFALRQLPGGDFLVGCTTFSGKSGDKSDPSRGDMDFWIIRIDQNGNKIWDKTIGGDYYDQINDIELAPDGDVYISGGTRSKPGTGELSSDEARGNVDFWLIKMDPQTRQIKWNRRFGGTGYEFPYALCVAGDGLVWMGGPTQSRPSPAGPSNNGKQAEYFGGVFDAWVVAVDASGKKVRDLAFGGSGHDEVYFIKEDNSESGRMILGGFSNSPVSGNKTEAPRGSYDYWLQGIEQTGEKKWELCIGGENQDVMYYFDQIANGAYILGGTSLSNKSVDKTENLHTNGMADFWIVRTKCAVSVDVDPKQISLPCASNDVSMTATPANCKQCQFDWSTGDTTATIALKPGFQDTVYLTLRDRYSCFANDTIPVSIGSPPTIQLLSKDTLLLFGETLQVGGSDPSLNYLWSTGETTAVISIKNKGVYSVTVTNDQGCTATNQIIVRQQDVPAWWTPNVFSPNDDGQNDYFNIWVNDRDVKRVHTFQIADRWGSILYKKDDYLPDNSAVGNGWDGRQNGQYAAPGPYLWIAEIEYNDGIREVLSGTLALIR
jgi:gliding motility-associated-like protein